MSGDKCKVTGGELKSHTLETEVAETKIVAKKIELGRVLFEVESGGELTLPKRLLPKNISVGDTLVLDVVTENCYVERKKDIAKALLNEILNADDQNQSATQKNK